MGWRSYTESMLDFEISAVDAAALLKERKARLIDVREPWEFATAKVEESVLMPMGDVPARAHQELDPDEHLIVMCHAGVRSMNVTVWLRNQGFEQVQSLRGGIDAWSREVDPAVARY
ncbi:MAG TPA: rhodanese-like domain-containing protein [Terracidiphilus sp.]|nr:rhodanese-like domain-containing protein [Terracidiphilus sp.]